MRIFLIIALINHLVAISSQAQDNAPSTLSPYFNAIVVSDMDSSLNWYQQVLGFEIKNDQKFPSMGFRQANLSRKEIGLELIELQSALSLQEVIPNYNQKTKVIGLFKFGFKVEDFDQWMEYLQFKNVRFNGKVVSNPLNNKRMIIILDPDDNRIQLFEQ